eukprot:5840907-Pleurochrysis_carterae.AAC.3
MRKARSSSTKRALWCVRTNRSSRRSRQGQSTHSRRLPLKLAPPHSNFSVRWDALQTGSSGSLTSTPPTSKDPSRAMTEKSIS